MKPLGTVKTKKSDHKHNYTLRELKEPMWFTHEKICTICGHVNNQLRISE